MPPMTGTDDLACASAIELSKLLRARKVSSEELVRATLARIERCDPKGSIFVQVLADRAIKEAKKKDESLVKGEAAPPFHGIPIGIKDLNLVRGAFTRFGSKAFKWVWSPVDDRTVARIRSGGFVIVGKLATSELGALPITEPAIHPPTRNPWSSDHTAGGSSGGTGAALAARLVPVAQGSDGAGSIRIPSSFCHLFGLKPSRGRLDRPYGSPDPKSLSTCGPMGHTVDDVAALLDVMAARSDGPESFLAQARTKPKRMRIRMTLKSPLVSATPAIATAVKRVAKILEDLGHRVEEGTEPEGSLEEFLPLWQYAIARAPVFRRSQLQPITRWLYDAGKPLTHEAVLERHRMLETRLDAWFGDADLYLTPTVAEPPPPIGVLAGMSPEEGFTRAARIGAFTALFNITGQPAANIPAGIGEGNLPIGVQIAGPRDADGIVLAVARELEEAMPWRNHRPRNP